MGLLDSMFGGGTKVELSLDVPQASAGGVVGGKITVFGGKKPLRLTELSVKLIYVAVTSVEGQAMPNIDTRILLTQTVTTGEDLPPESQKTYNFRFTVPHGTELTAHNVSYKVLAVADIPSVKDPSADLELKVVAEDKDKHRKLPIEEVYSRFPGLRSTDEDTLCDELRELFLACYSEGGQFMEVEPALADMMRRGTVRIRRSALEAWANLVDNRVTPQHLETLYAVANMPGLDDETFEQVVIAACKFAEEGAYHLVAQLAQHPSGEVRKQVAQNLRFNAAEKFAGKRELAIQLAQDQDPSVRAAAIGTFSCFRDDQQIMHGVANQIDRETDPDVQAAGISTLCLAHQHGLGELTLAVYEKHTQNPSPRVRRELAENLHSLPKATAPRIYGLAQRLLADEDIGVRKAMAFQFYNLGDFPQLLPLIQHTVQNDPSPEVRREALGSIGNLLPVQQIVPFYHQVLTADGSEDTMWAVLSGLRNHAEHPLAKKMLVDLTNAPYPGLADAARELQHGC